MCGAALANASPTAAKGLICLPYTNPAFDGRVQRQERSEEDLSGTFKLSYRASPNVFGYASYSRGFKAGGFNLDRTQTGVTPNSDTAFEDETNETYEIGVKTNWFGNRLLLNATAFSARIENFQINSFVGTSFIVISAPEVESVGLDLDAIWQTPIDGLSLQGGAS